MGRDTFDGARVFPNFYLRSRGSGGQRPSTMTTTGQKELLSVDHYHHAGQQQKEKHDDLLRRPI